MPIHISFNLSELFELPPTCCMPSTAMPVCTTGALHMKVWVSQTGPMTGQAIGKLISSVISFRLHTIQLLFFCTKNCLTCFAPVPLRIIYVNDLL